MSGLPARSSSAPIRLVPRGASFALACHACGRCCNSPPSLSMRELFRHRERFVASIAIARVPRRRLGERIRIGELDHELDAEDLAAHDALADRLYPRIAPGGDCLSLSLRGHDYASRERCPALSDDGHCSLHAAGKPAICEAVPLDPLAPDRLQAFVLGARREQAEWIGAGCLSERGEPDVTDAAEPLVEAGRVLAGAALAACREALEVERAIWRDAIAAQLIASGPEWARSWAQLPPGAHLTIPAVPALLAIARISSRCREATIEVLDCQRRLIGSMVEAALERRLPEDRATTRELRAHAEACEKARRELASIDAAPVPPAIDSAAVEAWLGLA
ncbi:flagellin N-methylase [Burkholderia gladioli]|uniref:Flagellin N-methylase n=2 Tax=Burkholderia gladioli TaxID=28095 RepID=A0A2A7SGZ3_BURGA|nr:flagellin N-methylase [Burkholderia gladioli]MBU9425322.1 flagellin N-methylase [Burkholderia gladioli]MDN8061155.1 flagellin N-methylase [Burkholderia gladioli]PEH42540.1 flagellin N-methylase [Burkholderia gladioli]QPQ86617.1 flagellin N-methylase [Burkholderia gladioli]